MGFWARIIRAALNIDPQLPTRRRGEHRSRRLRVEGLEDRALLTVTALFVDGHLSVASDWNDEIIVDVEQGFVKINGADPSIGAIAAADVTGLSVRGGLLSRNLDVSGTSQKLAERGVSITIPRVTEYVAELYATTDLDETLDAAFASGLLTQSDINQVTLGHVDVDLLDRLSQAGVSQELIDKGLEALDFFHAQDSAGQASRQMLMSASDPNAIGRTIYGTCGNDVINGGEGADTIYGGSGNDTIDGAEGNDTIYGGKGADSVNGGEGNDTMYGGDGVDTFNPNGAEGTDTIVQDGDNGPDLCTQPFVAIDDTVVDEAAGYANFAVRLNQVYDQDITITWKTVNGSATSAGDFTATTGGTLVIAAFSSSGTISVPINNDSLDETDESFNVEITAVTNAELGDGIATGTIIDNDTPSANMPTVSIASAGLVNEGDGGALFTVTLSQAINKTVRVHYATTTTGTAIDGTHYYSVSRDLYFEPNQTSRQIGVELIDDLMYEGGTSAPYFFVTLSSPLNALVGTASGYAQIIDDDPLPTLSIADVTVTEGDPGGPAVYMSVMGTLSNPANFDVTFTLVITSGTATNGGDYTLVSTIFQQTIPAGGLNSGVSFPIVADLTPEPTETFTATITSASVVLTDYQGTCTIIDQDTDPQITSDDPVATEGDPGDPAHYVTFTLSLSKASQKQVTVQVDTSDLTAVKVVDYDQLQNLIVTFAPGVTSRQVQVKIVDDLEIELDPNTASPEEKFKLNLSNPTNATTAIDFALGTIKDNDVDIDADINRDTFVLNTAADEAGEETIGTIVIADMDNVYTDPTNPARRREIVLRNAVANADVRVSRTTSNLKLYSAATGGTELFGGNNEITLSTNTSYWLQGGTNASQAVRDGFLRVRRDDNAAQYADKIAVTVLWVDLTANVAGARKASPIFDGNSTLANAQGHNNLGVTRSLLPNTNDGATYARANIEFVGSISPSDITKASFGTALTTNFVNGSAPATPAKADFGFIFSRQATYKLYANAQPTPTFQGTNYADDSDRGFQDVDPDPDGNSAVIVDADAPGAQVTATKFFQHARMNFTESVVFNFIAHNPERVSSKSQWATTLDTAMSYGGESVFVRDLPNNGGNNINDLITNGQLPSLDLGIGIAQPMAVDKTVIPRGVNTLVTITGTNLIGEVFLKKGNTEIKADLVRVKETDPVNHFSNLTEIAAVFNINAPADTGYVLIIRNAAGDSQSIPGFSIVN